MMSEEGSEKPKTPWMDPSVLDQYERDEALIYFLDTGGHLVWSNASWDTFAVENGTPELTRETCMGLHWKHFIVKALQPLYESAFEKVRLEHREFSQAYECPMPGFHRWLHLLVLPVPEGAVVVVNSPVGGSMDGGSADADERSYTGESGVVRMCAQCQRVQRPEGGSWDWVPNLVKNLPASVSHSLCPFCRTYHYTKA